jgi:L-2,4-diaminobutyrate decarboxylase
MHNFDESMDEVAKRIFDFARHRVREHSTPLGKIASANDLITAAGPTVIAKGIGGMEAMRIFEEVLEPNCLAVDYTKYLSFVPAAPTEAAVLFDLVVGACSIYGGSWIEGAGAVHAENEALGWLIGLTQMPEGAGGVFVSGGTIGNLSAMVGARTAAAERLGDRRPARWAFLASETSHSSVTSACGVMDADVITVPVDDDFRMTGVAVAAALDEHGDRIAGVVATAGTTNLGRIDHLREIGEACRERGVWLHVDAAYGGAALAAPSTHDRFDGIELADSVIIDPHKWLFAPFDCCALLWRDPDSARRAHAQHADYLTFLDAYGDWNPSDFAIHLSRRVRGLPLWFSLAMHGTDAYADAVEATLDLASEAVRQIRAADHVELVLEPSLSVVVFQRIGWDSNQYQAWSKRMMHTGEAFVVPSRHLGKPVYRFCFINPQTTFEEITEILDALR